MIIGLLGGTGNIGEGLALRFGLDTEHEIIIGSRKLERAEKAATDYNCRLQDHGKSSEIRAAKNEDAALNADIIILSIPPFHVGDTVAELTGQLTGDQILVSPAVGMENDESGMHYRPPPNGSVTELVADTVPDEIPVVGAFHNLAAERLSNLQASLNIDTLVVGNDEKAKRTLIRLANEVKGVRALDVGPLANASEVESVTPLVINIARYNTQLEDVGVKYQ